MSERDVDLYHYVYARVPACHIDARTYLEALSLRASGHVKRWHTGPIIGQQTVAEHSGQALTLLLMLCPSPSVKLIKAMLWHDSSERIVGDMPSPGKRAHPNLHDAYEKAEIVVAENLHPTAHAAIASLTHDELCWLRACDVLELYMFCCDQEMLGNQHATIIKSRARDWLVGDVSVPIIVKDFVMIQTHDGNRSHA